ncbi:MAG: Crp/Fnr family transcriptional regulator [Phenylobacterium sp.]
MSELFAALNSLAGGHVRLAPGQVLFRRGDPVRNLYLVRCGCVQLARVDAAGTPAVMQRAKAGQVLAESSLFSSAYYCDAEALTQSELTRLRKTDVLARMAAEPPLMSALAEHLAREVQHTRVRVEVLAKRTVAERLDAWLVFHEEGLPPAGQWRGVAEDIGVSPEAFYRELARRRAAARR